MTFQSSRPDLRQHRSRPIERIRRRMGTYGENTRLTERRAGATSKGRKWKAVVSRRLSQRYFSNKSISGHRSTAFAAPCINGSIAMLRFFLSAPLLVLKSTTQSSPS